MKVALLHDYLNQYGGAERVLQALLELFPQADLYTLLYDEERTNGSFGKHTIRSSRMNWKFVRRHHRPFIPLMPMLAGSMRLEDDYDLIISDTAGYGKGIAQTANGIGHMAKSPVKSHASDHGAGKKSYHIMYCHTPLRYAWETKQYFSNTLFTTLFQPAFSYLRRWDYRAAQIPHKVLVNSRYIQDKVRRYYGRESTVVYPPIREELFYYDPAIPQGDYFLAVGRLLPYKKFDLILEAWKTLPFPLKIVGGGPERKRLIAKSIEHRGKGNIEFLGYASDEKLRALYAGARALVFPQVEDFGLVAAEAIACGTPVIAFRGGGVTEIVHEGVNGHFFEEQTPEALREAVVRHAALRFPRTRVSKSVAQFSKESFQKAILAHIPKELRFPR